jgi:molecular chaperone GrpE
MGMGEERPGDSAGQAGDATATGGMNEATRGGDTSGQPAAASEAPAADMMARLAELEARCAALQDQYLRSVAETENVRRRAQDDVSKAHKYGIESFAESLLPVRDSLELALRSGSPSIDSLKEGVEATLRLLASVFEKNKLLEIDPAGQKFDPNQHQAISMVPGSSVNPAVPANHVVAVLQKGYLINDRVLRPALVTVAQG